MEISEWQSQVDLWIKEYGVRYFNVMTNTLLLNEEVGEFSRLVARAYGEQSFKEEMPKQEIKKNLADEMSDIIFVVTCLANQLDIDLTKALNKNLQKKTKRDSTRHTQNPKLSEDVFK